MTDGWQVPGSTPDDGRPPPQQGPDLTKPSHPAPPPGSVPAPMPAPMPAPGPAGWGGQQQYGYGYGAAGPPPVPVAPRPGVVPLRPLSLGEIYDGAFQVMRRNPGPMIGSAAIVGGLIAVATALFQLLAGPSLAPFLDPATVSTVSDEEALGALGAFGAGGLVTGLVTAVGVALLSGVLVLPVSRAVTGQRTTFGEVWTATWPRFWALLGLVGLAFLIAVGIYLGTILVPVLLGAAIHPGFLVLLVVTLPLLLLGLLWLMVRSAIALPALMLERTGPLASWRRVRTLVGGLWTGPFWRSLGILLLAGVIVGAAQFALSVPAGLINLVIAAADPTNPLAAASLTAPQVLVTAVFSIIASAVVYPFQAGVGTLLYVDHRMRREGLDVELARAASQ